MCDNQYNDEFLDSIILLLKSAYPNIIFTREMLSNFSCKFQNANSCDLRNFKAIEDLSELEHLKRWDLVLFILNIDTAYCNCLSIEHKIEIVDLIINNNQDDNKLYTIAKLGSRELIQLFIDKSSEDEYQNIAKVLHKLQLLNIAINDEAKLFLEEELLLMRNSGKYEADGKLDDRINEVLRMIKDDIWRYEGTNQVDDEFLLMLEYVAKHMFIIIVELKIKSSDLSVLPWKKVEFLLWATIFTYKKLAGNNSNVQFIIIPFGIDKILTFLRPFRDYPSINANDIENIDDNFEVIRSLYSLNRLQFYMRALHNSVVDDNQDISKLVIDRCLQVVGECLKVKEGNISATTEANIIKKYTKDFLDVCRKLRDEITHGKSTNNVNVNDEDWPKIKRELERIYGKLFVVIFIKQIAQLKLMNGSTQNTECEFNVAQQETFMSLPNLQTMISVSKNQNKNSNILKHTLINNYGTDMAVSSFMDIINNLFDIKYITNTIMLQSSEIINLLQIWFDALTEKLRDFDLLPETSLQISELGDNFMQIIFDNFASSLQAAHRDEFLNQLKFYMNIPTTNLDDLQHSQLKKLLDKYKIMFRIKSNDTIRTKKLLQRRLGIYNNIIKLFAADISKTTQDQLGELFDINNMKLKFKKEAFLAATNKAINDKKNNSNIITATDNQADLQLIEYEMAALNIFNESLTKLPFNSYFVDDTYPIPYARELRNHLAHNNAIVETMSVKAAVKFTVNNKLKPHANLKLKAASYKQRFEESLAAIRVQNQLHQACIDGEFEAFEQAISAGADIDGSNYAQLSVFHFSAQKDGSAIFKHLLCNQLFNQADLETIFEITIKNRNIDNFNLLLHYFGAHGSINNMSYLHIAAINNYTDIAHILLTNNVCVDNKIGVNNQSALHCATLFNNLDIAQFLISNSCNINSADKNGFTALHIAAMYGYEQLLLLLLKAENVVINFNAQTNYLRRTALHLAVINDNLECVECLLLHEAAIDDVDVDLKTALHLSAEYGYYNIFTLLINKGANVQLLTRNRDTLLHLAAINGDMNIIEHVVTNQYYDINSKNRDGNTALHLAAIKEHEQIMEYLTDSHIDSSILNNVLLTADNLLKICVTDLMDFKQLLENLIFNSGYLRDEINVLNENNDITQNFENNDTTLKVLQLLASANLSDIPNNIKKKILNITEEETYKMLQTAAINGRTETVRQLLEDAQHLLSNSNYDKHKCIHFTAMKGHVDTFKLLLTYVDDDFLTNHSSILVFAALSGDEDIMNILIDKKINVNSKFKKLSALYVAALIGHTNIVTILLRNEADIELGNIEGRTALFAACHNGSYDIVNLLINSNANVHSKDNNGYTPLFAACFYNRLNIINLLIDRDANVNLQSKHGSTVLLITSLFRHLDAFHLLLARNADIHLKLDDGTNCFFLACYNGDLDIVELLLERKADIHVRHVSGTNSLSAATCSGNYAIVKLLLENNVHMDSQNVESESCLHSACLYNYYDIVKLLLQYNANIDAQNFTGHTSLYIACENGHLDIVKLLLQENANVNLQNYDGNSPLMVATENDYYNIVKLLLQYNANIDAQDSAGATSLNIACEIGHLDIVTLLLQNSANINLQNFDGYSPLFTACENDDDDYSIVQLLLQYNADINQQNHDGGVCLHAACAKGHSDIIRLLLESNANVDLQNNGGNAALHLATLCCDLEIIELLLDRNANIDIQNKRGNSPLFFACKCDLLVQAKLLIDRNATVDTVRSIPLLAACHHGNFEITKLLLNSNANVNIKDEDGNTPLCKACEYDNYDIVQLLLTTNANVNLQNDKGASPLFIACQLGHTDIVNLLLKNKANVHLTNEDERTSLHTACEFGNLDIVKSLLNSNANVDSQAKDLTTPLHITCQNGHDEIAQLLLQCKANVNLQAIDGTSPLYAACAADNLLTAKVLLENNASIDLQNDDGNSPLWVASSNGYTDVVKLLLEMNANVDLQNNNGITSLFIACQHGHTDVVELLLQEIVNVDLQNKNGTPPLFTACQHGHIDVVKLLLQKSANVDLQDRDGFASLHIACFNGRLKIVKLLLESNAKVDLQDKLGSSALHVAALTGYVEVIKLLIDNNARIDLDNILGFTPLHIARARGYDSIVNVLLELATINRIKELTFI